MSNTREHSALAAQISDLEAEGNELHDLLLQNHGVSFARVLLLNRLLEREAAAAGVTVTEKDIAAEYDIVLRKVFGKTKVAPAERAKLLSQFIRQDSHTRLEWDMAMRRNAILAKLAAGKVEVSEKELREEYHKRYGFKVEVRDIQVPTWDQAHAAIQRVRKGASFAEVAKEVSRGQTAPAGGLLPPISKGSRWVPDNLKAAALSLEKPGDLSGVVMVQKSYHVLQLVKRHDPKDVPIEMVRDPMRRDVAARKAEALKDAMRTERMNRLRDPEHVRVVNPTVRKLLKRQEKGETP